MSELKKTRDVSTYQKLSPPKSLQGEKDAEVTWDLILNRYPNAAPLLCQMENVIERAEGLLQQLRSPYTHALERSSSFQIADSEDELMGHVDESIEVSMISEKDSRLASAEDITSEEISNDFVNKIDGKSVSEIKVCSIDVGNSENASLEEQTMLSPEMSDSSIFQSNSKSHSAGVSEIEIRANIGQEESLKSVESSIVGTVEGQTSSKKLLEVEKSSSLEAWGKVVGESVTDTRSQKSLASKKISSGPENTKEDSVSEHARRLSTLKSGPMQQITKLNLLGKKEELMQRFAGTIATASKVVDTTSRLMKKNDEEDNRDEVEKIVDRREKNCDSVSSDERKTGINESGERTQSFEEDNGPKVRENVEEEIKADDKTETEEEFEKGEESSQAIKNKQKSDKVKGNGDDGIISSHAVITRSAIEILDDYSKICGIQVEYKNLNPSCSYNKNIVVKCCFGGFAFEACAQAKKIAKKDAAAKLLRCLAGRQIDGENMLDLIPFNRKQIAEIISLGNGGEHETAVRKLYKICMELNAPEPIYTVHQDSGIVGSRYTVKCGALGITTSGYGIRVLVAKRVAADKLLHDYNESRRNG